MPMNMSQEDLLQMVEGRQPSNIQLVIEEHKLKLHNVGVFFKVDFEDASKESPLRWRRVKRSHSQRRINVKRS